MWPKLKLTEAAEGQNAAAANQSGGEYGEHEGQAPTTNPSRPRAPTSHPSFHTLSQACRGPMAWLSHPDIIDRRDR